MSTRRGKRRPKRVKPGARVTEGPMADYSEPSRGSTSRSRRERRDGGSGPPVPLIVGGVVVAVLVLIGGIFALGGGGGSGGGSSSGARKAAKRYLSALKAGDIGTLVNLEHLTPSDAESLCSDYQRKVHNASGKRIPIKARGVGLHRASLYEMGDLDFGKSDKVELAQAIIVIAYKFYFDEGKPRISFEIEGVDVDGDRATVRLEMSVRIAKKDPPELVMVSEIADSRRLSLVRIKGKWKVSR